MARKSSGGALKRAGRAADPVAGATSSEAAAAARGTRPRPASPASGPGRRRRRSAKAPDTAEALLAAGLVLFSRRGYDGTSVRALAAAAGVNLGAMTYHFGTKRGLYDRVVERAVAPLAEAVEAAVAGAGSPLERVEAVVRTYFGFVGQHPEVLRLMIQELLLDRPPPAAALALMRRTHGTLLALVRAGQADDTIRRGIPELLAVNIMSAPIHMALVKQPLQAALGFDLADPRERERAVLHLQEFTRSALAARPEVMR